MNDPIKMNPTLFTQDILLKKAGIHGAKASGDAAFPMPLFKGRELAR
jgi:hypothetical protein